MSRATWTGLVAAFWLHASSVFAGLSDDIRVAFRKSRARPTAALLAVATVTLGIGVCTGVFSVISAVLLKPLPYNDAGRLVMVWNVNPGIGRDIEQQRSQGSSMSLPEFQDWQERSGVFERMVAFGSWFGTIDSPEGSEVFFGYQASPGLFELLGTKPLLGRPFLPEEENGKSEPAIALQYDFWKRRFGADPRIIGQTIQIRRQAWRVVAVMPPGFVFFSRQIEAITTQRLPANYRWPRQSRQLRIMARLKPGMTLAQGQAKADLYAAGLAREYPETNRGWRPLLVSLADDASGPLHPGMLVLLAAVGCVLIGMCVNVTNLLLVQATARAKELAIRSALGASRWRIVRQLLVESLGISLIGGAAGLGLAFLVVRYFRTLLPDRYTWGKYLVQAEGLQVDSRVIAFAFAAAVVAGLFAGLVPALHVTGSRFNEELKEASRGTSGGRRTRRVRNALVVSGIAIAVVLVIGAGLLVESFLALQRQGSGFRQKGVLTVSIQMPTQDLNLQAQSLSREDAAKVWAEATSRFRERTTQELLGVPGVEAVTTSGTQPMSAFYFLSDFVVEGRDPDRESERLQAVWSSVARNYFSVVGLPLLRGRAFGPEDRRDTPPNALISESAARLFWPGEDALGKRFKFRNDRRPEPWLTVVGICGDIYEDGLHRPPKPYIYASLDQNSFGAQFYVFLKSATPNPYSLVSGVQRVARQLDPRTIVYRPRTLDDLARDSTWHLNYAMLLLSSLAWLSLFLALIGVYGVLSCSVRERTAEIGIRVALGANRSDILALILTHALLLGGIGASIGIVVSLGLTRFLKSLLYGVHPPDPVTFAAVPLCLVLMAVVASYIPARRATRVDPISALRYE